MRLSKWFVASGLAFLSVLAIATTDARAKDPSPQVIEIHSKKFAYEPAEVTLHKGVMYKLHLTSDDVPHTLRIKELNLNEKMTAGEFNDVLFTPAQPGDFKADCGLYCGAGHKTMAMTVHVVE
ncbi:MAG TPA: cupredoxin domain-containing protein [Edaphobacter sp.]